ncbi:hypothetical protein Avbf_12966 [Armadillidium vulgare]|nr:hypothetical protein Avbf_12966 [Armadillidium vulgare]
MGVGSGTGMSPVGLPETHDMCEPSQRPVCPEVCKAFEGVGFIAEHTRREEESVRAVMSEPAGIQFYKWPKPLPDICILLPD